jgi:1-phosphatidylinositol phosphodiesterase
MIHQERHNYRSTAPFIVSAAIADGTGGSKNIQFQLDGCDAGNMAHRGVVPIIKGSSDYSVIQVTTAGYEIKSAGYENGSDWNCMTIYITPLVNTRKWMAKYPNKSLTQLTIPGTHNSGTAGGNAEMGTRCQSMDIRAQLESGIRFFDLRLVLNDSANPDDLGVFHGPYFQNLWLGKDILPVIGQFLKDNEDECVIICANRENDQGSPIDAILKTLLTNGVDKLFDDNNAVFHEKTLADLKGHVVIVRRSSPATFGLQAIPWPDDKNNASFSFAKDGNIQLQDAYEYGIERLPSLTYQKKWKNVEDHLDRAKGGGTADWFINFTSASHSPPTAMYYPWDFATGQGQYGVNYLLSRYLVKQVASTGTRLGTVAMDYPEEPGNQSLIRLLLAMNA